MPTGAVERPDNQGRKFILGFGENLIERGEDVVDLELFITTTSTNTVAATITDPHRPSDTQTVSSIECICSSISLHVIQLLV